MFNPEEERNESEREEQEEIEEEEETGPTWKQVEDALKRLSSTYRNYWDTGLRCLKYHVTETLAACPVLFYGTRDHQLCLTSDPVAALRRGGRTSSATERKLFKRSHECFKEHATVTEKERTEPQPLGHREGENIATAPRSQSTEKERTEPQHLGHREGKNRATAPRGFTPSTLGSLGATPSDYSAVK
uniref:Uncharacterized protein n=1 Tax=Timema douglasi TaxID=61478 RepID=A0A7R8VEM3_TIMDO|nr:unnamed protein product [Timema douglasi]